MTVHCYQIDHTLKLSPIISDKAVEMARDPAEKIWIDVQGAETFELEAWLDELQVKHLARQLCLDGHERPGFYPLNTFILLVIPMKAPADPSNKVEHVTFLCNRNFLLTLRDEHTSRIQQIAGKSADWLQNRSIASLASAIMMMLSLDLLQQMSELRKRVSELESRMESAPEKVGSEIMDQRSRILAMETVVIGQLPSFQALLSLNNPLFEVENARDYLVSAVANVQSAERSLHWLHGRVDLIRSDIEMRSQDKLNSRLARLTILSTIFMPITFLAGIWGMNFEYMPELGNPLGYWMALGFMALISVGMFLFFRQKDWFT